MAGTEGRRTHQDLYLEISRDLTDDEVSSIRTYIVGDKKLPAGPIQRATAQEMFNKLERKGVLKRGDLSFLAKLMESIDRMDYAEAANEISEQEREALEERIAEENSEPALSGAQTAKLSTSTAGKQRLGKGRNHEKKPYSVSRPNTTQTAVLGEKGDSQPSTSGVETKSTPYHGKETLETERNSKEEEEEEEEEEQEEEEEEEEENRENRPQSSSGVPKRPAMKLGKQRMNRRKRKKRHRDTTKPDSMLLGMDIEYQSVKEMEMGVPRGAPRLNINLKAKTWNVNLEEKKRIIKGHMHDMAQKKLKRLEDWEDRRLKKMANVMTKKVFKEHAQQLVLSVNELGARIHRADEGCVIFYLEFDDDNGLEKFWASHKTGRLSKYFSDQAITDELRNLGGDKTLHAWTVALEEDYLAWKHYFNGTTPSSIQKNRVTVVRSGCVHIATYLSLNEITIRTTTDEQRKSEGQDSVAKGVDEHTQPMEEVVGAMQQLRMSEATAATSPGTTPSKLHEGKRQRRKSGGRKKHNSGELKKS